MTKKGWLDEDVYRTLLENSPIPTADFILIRKCENANREFLLTKRTENPYKGNWFVPGGRILKGERMADAVHRILRRELGITKAGISFIGCLDVWNPPKLGVRWHSIWHFYTAWVNHDAIFRLNNENAATKWFTSINPRWPAPVRKALGMAHFK
ncbi:MAG: NUDIX domain-containing protein [bacterium]|nr:NUDIX domain-containing protein [bacterium]